MHKQAMQTKSLCDLSAKTCLQIQLIEMRDDSPFLELWQAHSV